MEAMEATWKDPTKPDGASNVHRDTCTVCRPGPTPYNATRCTRGTLLFRRWWHWANTGQDLPIESFASESELSDLSTSNEPTQKGNAPMTQVPTTTVRPLHDRILVKRVDAENKTPGGLFIPDNVKEKPVEGLVVAVGDGNRNKDGERIPLDVKAGDRVLFSKYSGTEVKVVLDLEGGEHLILREDDVLAVIG